MAQTRRRTDRNRGYSRSQSKAATQAVLGAHEAEWFQSEDPVEDGTLWSLFAVSAEEVAQAAQEPEPEVTTEEVTPTAQEAPVESPPVEKPRGVVDRALMALRFARS